MRLVRAEMLRPDFVTFVHASAVPARLVHYRHALRNCLMPVVTMTVIRIGRSIACVPVTEKVFQCAGMGLRLFPGLWSMVRFPVLQLFMLVVAITVFGDVLREVLDPRPR